MSLSRKRFYVSFSLACAAGYVWLFLTRRLKPEEVGTSYDVCLIHHFAHIPCPACGSTRSVLALMNGDLAGGLYWNPIGLLIFSALIISPLWIACDLLLKKDTLLRSFYLFEDTLRRRWVAVPAIALILANWIWNIWKNV